MQRFRTRVAMALLVFVTSLATDQLCAADLLELYAQALEFDPRFQSARIQLQIAEEGVRGSRAGVKPQIAAGLQTGRIVQDIRKSDNLLFQEGRRDFSTADFNISLTQPLYHADYFTAVQQAQSLVRRARYEFAAEEQDLILRLAQAHFEFMAARDDVESSVAERTAIGRQLLEAEERLASGLGTITAVHESRGRFALVQAREIESRDSLEATRQGIAEITGAPPLDLKRLSETFPFVEPDMTDVEAWVQAALFQNPRIKAIQAQLDAVQQDRRRQRQASRIPSLDLVTTYVDSDTGGAEIGEGGRESGTTNYGLRLNIPIFDAGRAASAMRNSALQYQQLVQRLELERRQVERRTRESFQGVISGITRVEALQQSVFSQESGLSQREEGLRAGLGTGLEVLDARRDLFSARRDLARARYLYILNSLRLKQAAGILSREDLRQIHVYLQ